MSWSDKPTEEQLGALYRYIDMYAGAPREKARTATKWAENYADRRQVSDELRRLRDLKMHNKLDEYSCFASELWNAFDFDDQKVPTKEQMALIYAILHRHMPLGRAAMASSWLGQNATRDEIGVEIDRLKALEKEYSLNEEECFISDIWKKFNK